MSELSNPRASSLLIVLSYLFLLMHFSLLFIFPAFCTELTFHRTWGFHFITYFPLPFVIIYYLSAVIFIYPRFAKKIIASWENHIWRTLQKFGSIGKYRAYIIISAASFIVFYFLRAKYGLLGDNFLLIRQIETQDIAGFEPGTLLIIEKAYEHIFSRFNLSAKDFLIIFNCILGPVFVFLSFCIADSLGKTSLQKGMFWIGLLLAGTIQYYFGYIEIYSIVALFILLFLWTSVLAIKDKFSIISLIILFIGAVTVHYMISAFAPVLVFVIYRKVLCRFASYKKLIIICIGTIILIPFTTFIYFKYVHQLLLPFFPTEKHPYAMFTWSHIWEYINSQILGAPAAFFMLIVLLM